jgi:outer membrane protein TolC
MQGVATDLVCFCKTCAPLARAIVLACALSVGGCAVGPNFTRPTAPSAARYTGDTPRGEDATASDTTQHMALGREIEGNWWTLFRSDAIDQLVKQAVEHNRNLVASMATLAQAQELALAQAGSRYPQVDLTAGVGRQQYGSELVGNFANVTNVAPFTYFAVGPTVSYTLDYTGGSARSVEQQYALAEVERHQLDAAYLTITGQAVMQSLAIASAHAQIATVEAILAQDRDNLRLVQTAFDNGSVAREDVVSAQSQIANDMTLLPPMREDLAKAHHALSVVLGRAPASELPPDVDLAQITLPLEVPVSFALRACPSPARHSRRGGATARGDQRRRGRAIEPLSKNTTERHGGAAITQSGPAIRPGKQCVEHHIGFDGGTLRAEKRAAVDAMRASAANYEQTVLEAFAQVADLLEALDHDAEQLDAQAQAQQAAQSSLDLARPSYREGNAGVLLVLDAERSYQQARLGYVRAVVQRYLDTVQLFLALGGTSPSGAPLAVASGELGAS